MDRTELLESALDSLTEGIALADQDGRVALWNRAAASLTGFASAEVVGRGVRAMLDMMVVGGAQRWIRQTDAEKAPGHGAVVLLRHKVGQQVPVVARVLLLPQHGRADRGRGRVSSRGEYRRAPARGTR